MKYIYAIAVVFIIAAGIVYVSFHNTVQSNSNQKNPASGTNTDNIVVPISQVVLPSGIIRYSIPVVIGGKTIQAMLDTGSTGFRILSSALPSSDYTLTNTPSIVSYIGPVTHGTIGQAAVTVGGLSTQIPVDIVQSITCEASLPNCDTQDIFGFDAIIGVGLRGQDVPNPLTYLGSGTWIINLPIPGSSSPGELILDPTGSDEAGYTPFPLVQQTASDVGAGIIPGWASDQISICVTRNDTRISFCKGASFDTGAFNVKTVPAGDTRAWPEGTRVTLTVINNQGASITENFTVGSEPGSEVFLDAASVATAKNLNTGPLPFFNFSILYNAKAGSIGLKDR